MLAEFKQTTTAVAQRLICESKQVRVERGCDLPEHCDDVHKVIRTLCTPTVLEKRAYVSEGKLICEVQGEVQFCVIYRAEDAGEILGITSEEFAEPFSVTHEVPFSGELPQPYALCVTVDTLSAQAKALTKKKLSVSALLGVESVMTANKTIFHLPGECEGLETLTQERSVTALVSSHEETLEVSEEFYLPEELKPVYVLLSTRLHLCPQWVRTEEDEVSFSVAAVLEGTYVSEADEDGEGRITSFSQPLEIAESLHIPDVTSESRAEVNLSLSALSVQVSSDQFGVRRALRVQISYLATALVYEKSTALLCRDAYSIRNVCRVERKTAELSDLVSLGITGAEEVFEFALPEGVDEVEATTVELSAVETSIETTGVAVDAVCRLHAIGVKKESGKVQGFDSEVRRELRFPIGMDVADKSDAEVRVTGGVHSAVGKVVDGKLIVHVHFYYTVGIWQKCVGEVVTDVECFPETKERFSGVRFYYPDGDESVWDIAKQFSVSATELAATLSKDKTYRPKEMLTLLS